MQAEIKIDAACKEPKIIILTDKMTDELNSLVEKISEKSPRILSGFRNDTLEILDQSDIFRLYATAGKVYAQTANGEYTLRLRLYELEELLEKDMFVRISNSEIIMRALLGAPIGLTISTLITIIFSLIFGEGFYFAVPHDLAAACGSEINAVMLQTLFASVYGAMWGGASVIWEMENGSLLKMTLTHLVVCSAASFPIAYFMQWMPHNIPGALCFFGLFFAIYAVIWLTQYCAIKRQVEQMNSRLTNHNL